MITCGVTLPATAAYNVLVEQVDVGGIPVVVTEELCEKELVMHKLHDMGLDQIANWIHALPEDKWKTMFMLYWPTLVKKCGIEA